MNKVSKSIVIDLCLISALLQENLLHKQRSDIFTCKNKEEDFM